MVYALSQASAEVFNTYAKEWDKFKACLDHYQAGYPEDPSDSVRVEQFYLFMQAANKLADGDYIEMGTHIGLTLKCIHKFMDPSKTLYSLDTFTGFDARDIAFERVLYSNGWTEGNFSPTSAGMVANYIGDGTPPANLKMIEGWFPEAFKGYEDKKWRFVHLDMDLYQPTECALDMLWKQMVPGGIIVVHDYGCPNFPGVRLAVDAFGKMTGQLPVEMPDRWGSAVLRKPLYER